MIVNVYTAQPVGDRTASYLHLTAQQPFPSVSPEEGDRIHAQDAQAVVSGLLASLPGGTLDRILVLLLQRQTSRLRVRWPE